MHYILSFLLFLSFLHADVQNSINVVFPKNFPPHYIYEDGKPDGFAHDIFKYIQKDLDLHVNYVPKESWEEVWHVMDGEGFYIIPDVGITKEREKYMDYSEPFEFFFISLYTTVLRDYTKVEDLRGKSIAVVKRNAVIPYLQKNYSDIELKIYDKKEDAFVDLISGKVDAFAYPEAPVESMIELFGAHSRVKKFVRLLEIKGAVGVKKGHKELVEKINNSLIKLKQSNQYREIFTKWHYSVVTKDYTKKDVQGYLLLGLGIFLLMIMILFFILRINRKLKTEVEINQNLQDELESIKHH